MSRKIVLALGTLALVAACAAPQVPLKPEARAELDVVDSVLIVPPGKARNGTPLFANAGTRSMPSIMANASSTPDPILEALHDYDLPGALRAAWKAEALHSPAVRFGPRLRVERFSPTDPAGLAQMRMLFDDGRGSAMLFASIDYALKDSALVVSAEVEIYPRAPTLLRFRYAPEGSEPLDEGSVIYRQRFMERQPDVTADTARAKLEEALQGIVRQIIASLNETR